MRKSRPTRFRFPVDPALSTKAYYKERHALIEGKNHAWTQLSLVCWHEQGTSHTFQRQTDSQLISTRLCMHRSCASWPTDAVSWTPSRFRIPGTGSGVGRPKPRHLIRVFRELSRECLPNSSQSKRQKSRGEILACDCDFAARNLAGEMDRMASKTRVGRRKYLLSLTG